MFPFSMEEVACREVKRNEPSAGMDETSSRRPLKSRSSRWAGWMAAKLARSGATPNGISAASVGFALAGGLLFVAAGQGWVWSWAGWVAGALCVQARLICNLLDGMVAIEGGKKSATGDIWNEAPDRFADALLLVGAGIGCGHPWLGAGAAWAAAMTAYVRALGASLTGAQDFSGPFAKPQRMAALTGGAVATAFYPPVMGIVLWVVCLGTVFTVFRRLARLAKILKQRREG
ncbi:MAG: CDP-alcohol phosphatidyltransferase family protein [Luteolibacter sp.]